MADNKSKSKKNNTKQSPKANKEIPAKDRSVKFKWVSASLLFAFFTALFLFFTTEPLISSIINNFLYGLNGKVAALFPIAAICLAIYVVKCENEGRIASKYIITSFILWLLSAFVHLCSSSVENPITAYQIAYSTFTGTTTGGFFGAIVAYPLYWAIGKGATIAIIILLELILVSLLIHKSIFTLFVGLIRGAFGILTDEQQKVNHTRDFEQGKEIATKKIGKIKNKGYDYVVDDRSDTQRGSDIIGVAKDFADDSASPKKPTRKANKPKASDIFSEGVLEGIEDNGIDDVFGRMIENKGKLQDEVGVPEASGANSRATAVAESF